MSDSLLVKCENIFTYSFKGHYDIIKNSERIDKQAFIGTFLDNKDYHKYLFNQTNHFLLSDVGTDIDHLTILIKCELDKIVLLKETLSNFGYLYELPAIDKIERFSVHFGLIKNYNQFVQDMGFELTSESENKFIVLKDFVEKIRFTYNKETNELRCIPLVFPQMNLSIKFNSDKSNEIFKNLIQFLPLEFPLNNTDKEPYYSNICLLLSLSLFKFVSELMNKKTKINFFIDFQIDDFDLSKFYVNYNDIIKSFNDFLNNKSIDLDKYFTLTNNANPIPEFSNFKFSKKDVPGIIKRLRIKYIKKLKEDIKNNITYPTKYSETIDELYCKELSNKNINNKKDIHPFVLTEVIDELCDFSILVPTHKKNEGGNIYYRSYRSGECNQDIFNWERSKYIFTIALMTLQQALARENIKHKYKGVERMILEKILTNFIYDFSHMEQYGIRYFFNTHCYFTEPNYWGPQCFLSTPIHHTKIGLTSYPVIEKDTKIDFGIKSGIYSYNKDKKTYLLNISSPVFKSFYQKVNDYIDENYIKNYFNFLVSINSQLSKSGKTTAKDMNSFIVCRDFTWFCRHIAFNINEWFDTVKKLIEKIKYVEDYTRINNFWFNKNTVPALFEEINKSLIIEGHQIESYEQKLSYANNISSIFNDAKNYVNSIDGIGYINVWENDIKKPDIDNFNQEYSKIKDELMTLINAMYALSNILRQKLKLYNSEKLQKAREYNVTNQLNKINFNILNCKYSSFNEFIKEKYEYNNFKLIFDNILRKIKDFYKDLKNKVDLFTIENNFNKKHNEITLKNFTNSLINMLPNNDRSKILGLYKMIENSLETSESNIEEQLLSTSISNPKKLDNNNYEYIITANDCKFFIKTKVKNVSNGIKKEEILECGRFPKSIFISYSYTYGQGPDDKIDSKYQQKVKQFVNKLIKDGYNVDIDYKEDEKKVTWDIEEFEKYKIKENEKIVVILSEGYKTKVFENKSDDLFDENCTGVKREYKNIKKLYNDVGKEEFLRRLILISLREETLENIKPFNCNLTIIKNVLGDFEKYKKLKKKLNMN